MICNKDPEPFEVVDIARIGQLCGSVHMARHHEEVFNVRELGVGLGEGPACMVAVRYGGDYGKVCHELDNLLVDQTQIFEIQILGRMSRYEVHLC